LHSLPKRFTLPRVFNVVGLTRAIVRDQTLRRQTMFYVVLAAVGMLFLGCTVFADFLQHDHPLTFLFYWAACGWLTILSVLMAIFDLLLLRAAARAARKKLEASYLHEVQQAAEEKER
jgi:TRAP-type C4-dicarboxylate transport system permease small subunit